MKLIIFLTLLTGVSIGVDSFWLTIPAAVALLFSIQKYCHVTKGNKNEKVRPAQKGKA